MVDITHKTTTLRIATAEAVVRTSHPDTIRAIHENRVPKGNVLDTSRAAGLLGIKKTPDILPDCHPLPIEFADIQYNLSDQEIQILVTVKTIYKTGVEVEAMHGASVVALNIYDMLKPIDKGVEISNIRLLNKSGGKSSRPKPALDDKTATVIICSDSVFNGDREDKSGKVIVSRLQKCGFSSVESCVVPDDISAIQQQLSSPNADFIVCTGGTGVSPRDVTPEAILPLLDKRLPGVEETIRRHGQDRMPYGMLSRSVAGIIGSSVVIALPGSTGGVQESLDAILPHIFHIFSVLKGREFRHE